MPLDMDQLKRIPLGTRARNNILREENQTVYPAFQPLITNRLTN